MEQYPLGPPAASRRCRPRSVPPWWTWWLTWTLAAAVAALLLVLRPPDIRAALIAHTRVNMHRKLLNMAKLTGLYPLAVLSDCVLYPSPGRSPLDFLPYSASGKPIPGGFRLGPTPGMAKLEGVRETAWSVDLTEQGLNPARHIKGGDAVLDDGGRLCERPRVMPWRAQYGR